MVARMSYLAQLMLRLAGGAGDLPEPVRRRHAEYVTAAQRDDGGFAGRRGASDPYYTSFALRTLAILGRLDGDVARPAVGFLAAQLENRLSPVDFLALVGSAALVELVAGEDVFSRAGRGRQPTLIERTAPLRRDDGGYAKTARSGPSSTYHTFLVAAAREAVGLPIDDADAVARMVLARQRPDGGFVEVPAVRLSGTNPTAAALGLLQMAGRLDAPTGRRAADFAVSMQTPEGGFQANTRIPVADLLSTFTALSTLADLDAFEEVDRAVVRRYAASLESPEGGFRGGAWDNAPDVEYTFYGVGCLALLGGGAT